MRQAAHYDLHTTEGLAQVQHLRFVLPSGEVDTQFNGMTIRGGVLDDGIREIPGSEIIDGRCALQLPRLAAGCHRYDVLVSGDGTDKPLLAGVIHVAPRVTPVDVDDNAPADYLDIVIPEDEGGTITVISESPAWVDDAVEESLQQRGMYVTPVSGTASMSPPGYDQDQTVEWSWARFRFGDDMLGGYRGSVCKVRDVGMWAVLGTTDTTPRWLDIWRRAPGEDWVLAARSSQAVAARTDVDLYMWGMIGDTEMVIGDEVALHVYGGTPEAPVELPLSIARQMVTAADGRGIASALDGPITDTTVMPAVMLSCTYQDGVSVGGVNLATRAEVQRLTDYTGNVGKQVYQDARASEAARDTAQEIAEGLSITVGTVTTGAPGSQATATLTPGSTPGAWRMDMTIPRGDVGTVDTAQAYTWTQPQTYDAMINANGGINIPLTVGAQTGTAAVNRLYAAGMAGVTDIYTQHVYLNTGAITATGTASTKILIPGQYAQTNVPANTHSTVIHTFTGPHGQWNYSSFAGFSIPYQLTAAGKITVDIGRGSKTTRQDLSLDSYSIIPGNNLAYNTGEILDITFDNVRDTARNGYVIRVREIYCTESTQLWKVKTTTSFIPASGNEPIPYIVNKIIYQQYEPRSYIAGDYGDAYGALYLLTGSGSNQQLWKIATVRGVTTFETGTGFNRIVSDVPGIAGDTVALLVGSAERTNYQPGNVNPVYYALAAIAENAIETEETTDFEDINVPIG
nr:MAG TPA: hypothetical protein [Caudoviricetes sp.]